MFKICLDYGHGRDSHGGDPGAVDGLNAAEHDNITTVEADMTYIVGKKVYNRLKALKDIEVVETRPTPSFISLDKRCKIANDSKCDIFVSIHLDSATKTAAHGHTSFCLKLGGNGEKLARMVHKRLVTMTGFADRGLKAGNFQVLRETDMPAALFELGFISNAEEEKKLHDTAFQEKVAQEIADGILEYKNQLTI